jgi:phosphorylcholine metabolism protein LicD
LILLAAIVFIVEVMKILTKIYSMSYYIDKDKCFIILCEIDDICKKYGVKYYLSEGTALGLYRNGDLIDWDDDIDIGMEESQYNIFVEKCLPELISRGYYLTYYYHPSINGYILGFNKYKQLIDIENVKVGEKCISKYGMLCDGLLPHIQKLTEKEWRGRMFPVPEESYYVYLYGKDWKIPKKTKNQS